MGLVGGCVVLCWVGVWAPGGAGGGGRGGGGRIAGAWELQTYPTVPTLQEQGLGTHILSEAFFEAGVVVKGFNPSYWGG